MGRSPWDEPSVLLMALNEVFIPILQKQFPEIGDFDLRPRVAPTAWRAGASKSVTRGTRGASCSAWVVPAPVHLHQFIIVTDDDINARDWKDVIWAMTKRMDPARDTLVVENTPIDYLDFASPQPSLGGKLGLTQTNKWPGETNRAWGKPIAMSEEVKAGGPTLGKPGNRLVRELVQNRAHVLLPVLGIEFDAVVRRRGRAAAAACRQSETRPKKQAHARDWGVVMNLPANLAESTTRTLTESISPPERLRQNAHGSHSRLVRIRCRHMFSHQIVFDPALIALYDKKGPRYTSYPTAVQFHAGFGEAQYRAQTARDKCGGPAAAAVALFSSAVLRHGLLLLCLQQDYHPQSQARAPYLTHTHREIVLQGALFDRARRADQLHWGVHADVSVARRDARIDACHARAFSLHDDDQGEYGIEVVPREVEPGALALLRGLGFNRLSMGVQDFDPRVQKAVNRIQGEGETFAVLDDCARAWFPFHQYGPHLRPAAPDGGVLRVRSTRSSPPGRTGCRCSTTRTCRSFVQDPAPDRNRVSPSPQAKLAILQHTIERLTAAGYVYIGGRTTPNRMTSWR